MSTGPRAGLLARLRQPRTWATVVVLLLVGALYLFSGHDGQDDATRPTSQPSLSPTAPAASARGERDQASGLDWIDAADLPREGRQTLVAIDNGGPFARSKDGSTFGNYEGVLPARPRGHYREYTVPTPGIDHAGPRRIVTGRSGEFYWTADHYSSFHRIRR